MTPKEVSQLNKDNFTPYERVGEDSAGWINGATPINADNLNKSDVALFNLLNNPNGYVYQLIDKLNTEISARLTDSRNLNSAIISEVATRKEADTDLETYISNEITKLAEDFVSKLTTQVNILNETIDNVDAAQSANYKNLTNRVNTKDNELTEKYKQVDSDVKTEAERAKKAEDRSQANIPTSVSQLKNDAGYLTEHQSLTNYVTTEQLEAKNYVEYETFNTQAVKTVDDLILNCGSSIENMFD
jgi:hypothetical protein